MSLRRQDKSIMNNTEEEVCLQASAEDGPTNKHRQGRFKYTAQPSVQFNNETIH